MSSDYDAKALALHDMRWIAAPQVVGTEWLLRVIDPLYLVLLLEIVELFFGRPVLCRNAKQR